MAVITPTGVNVRRGQQAQLDMTRLRNAQQRVPSHMHGTAGRVMPAAERTAAGTRTAGGRSGGGKTISTPTPPPRTPPSTPTKPTNPPVTPPPRPPTPPPEKPTSPPVTPPPLPPDTTGDRTPPPPRTGGDVATPSPTDPTTPTSPPIYDDDGNPLDVTGERILTTENEWESRAAWDVYKRRQETQRGLRDIKQLREQAKLDLARSKIADRQKGIATSHKDAALAEATLLTDRGHFERESADTRADILRDTAALDAREQQRIADAAAANIEAFNAEIAAREEEQTQIPIQTRASELEREAQRQQIVFDAQAASDDTKFATDKANAEALVISAAQGAGGQVIEAQRKQRRVEERRQVGRITARRDFATTKIDQQIVGIKSRGKVAKSKADAAVKKAEVSKQIQEYRKLGAAERKKLITDHAADREQIVRDQGRLQERTLEHASTEATLQAATYEQEAAGLGLDAEALRINRAFAIGAADDGLQALADRPPIPDWNAIGKKAEAAQRWRNAGSILGVAGGVLRIADWLF